MAHLGPLLVLAALIMGGAGCADVRQEQAKGTSGKTARSGDSKTSGPDLSDANDELCTAALQLNTLFDSIQPGDVVGMISALRDAEPELDTYMDNAPESLKGDVEVLAEAVRDLAGDLEAIKDDSDAASKARAILDRTPTERVVAAEDATNDFESETCGVD